MLSKMRISALLIVVLVALHAQEKKQPAVVTPGTVGKAPSDAVVLFDGRGLDHWRTGKDQPSKCEVVNAEMVCKTGSGDVYTTDKFRDAQIHLEFAVPYMPDQKGQLRGNSGVFCSPALKCRSSTPMRTPRTPMGCSGRFTDSLRRW